MHDIYDFDRVVDRHGTYCTQWDYVADRFGHADLLPFTISDMDFETAPCISQTLATRLEHGVFGYSRWNHDDFKGAVSDWFAHRYGASLDPETLVYGPSVIYVIAQLVSLWSAPGEGGAGAYPRLRCLRQYAGRQRPGAAALPAQKRAGELPDRLAMFRAASGPPRLPGFAALQPPQPHWPGLDAG